MPSQTAPITDVQYYGQNDTSPPLQRVVKTPAGAVVDLTEAAAVYITVAWKSFTPKPWGSYRKTIVDRALCVIDDAVNGAVSWHPAVGDLSIIGDFQYSFEVKWNDDTVSTHKSLAYDYIIVQTPPGGSRPALP